MAKGFMSRLAGLFRASAGTAPYQTTGSGARSSRWRPSAFGPNAALDYSAVQLRNQSRELVRKNPLAGSAVERIVANTVGTGIKPQVAEDVRETWNKWTDESAADGMLDFYGQQAQVMRAVVESGECFVRLRARRISDGLVVPFQIEVLEPELLPIEDNRNLANNAIVRQGIEFHPVLKSKRIAYWFLPQRLDDAIPGMIDPQPVRVPASEILHIFWPGRPGQIRGEPWFARVLDRLKTLESYDRAELVRKEVAAMLVGFIRRDLPEGLSIDDLQEIWGEDVDGADGVANIGLEPGTLQSLLPGEQIDFSDPKDVGGQYATFMESQHRSIAAGLGILYEQLTGDYSKVNDRTWRAAVNEFRRRCEMWQHHLLVFQFCRPVWRRFAVTAMLSGAIGRNAVDIDMPVRWMPPAWPYINPVQDVQARREEVRAGFSTRSAVISERGEDAATIDAENAADKQRADDLGLIYETDVGNEVAPIGHNGGPALDKDANNGN